MEEIFTDTSFYYFYSTVPQVLAGGIALVGAFLIFFTTESNKILIRIMKDTLNYIVGQQTERRLNMIELAGEENIKKLREIDYIEKKYYGEIMFEIDCGFKESDNIINRNCDKFDLEINLKSNVVKGGIRAVVLSGILMAFCIFILPFVQGLIKFLPLGIFITVLITGFSCYAIYLIANVVVSAIRKL